MLVSVEDTPGVGIAARFQTGKQKQQPSKNASFIRIQKIQTALKILKVGKEVLTALDLPNETTMKL